MSTNFKARARWLAMACASAALLIYACKSGGPKKVEAPDSKRIQTVEDALPNNPDFQPDVKVLARAKGETVHISIQNVQAKALRVDATNFGVILAGKQDVNRFNPQAHSSTFPKVVIQQNQMATGFITFTGMGDLSGQRLIFNNPAVRASLAIIKGEVPVSPIRQIPTATTPGASPAAGSPDKSQGPEGQLGTNTGAGAPVPTPPDGARPTPMNTLFIPETTAPTPEMTPSTPPIPTLTPVMTPPLAPAITEPPRSSSVQANPPEPLTTPPTRVTTPPGAGATPLPKDLFPLPTPYPDIPITISRN